MQTTATNTQASAAATGSTTTTSSGAGTNLGTKDVFLKLLVAQIQNQNPLKPQDPTQMSSQLAQFNMVKQQISTNQLLTNISGSLKSSSGQASNAAGYLGHHAIVNTNSLVYDGKTSQNLIVQNNQAAAQADVQVVDSSGNVVKMLSSGPLQSGSHSFTWNGTTDAGTQAPAGQYAISVTATTAGGQSVATNTQLAGQVQAVNLSANGTQLVVNGTPVSLSKVQQILL
ncbi:MAG TPA: flagellar hook capping FlgD N-terminal domain-containing protein [Mariprofundaceae bacterium]|nr:flagellar hook capping FlgD N-terminal domain-containing protein [Mariprofundaceae bacterium]